MAEHPIPEQELLNRVYKGSKKTGDNVDGLVVLPYSYDSANSAWARSNSFLPNAYDYVSVNASGSTTDVYTFYSGGSSGTLVQTVTITYTDSTKATISSVARS